MKKLFLLLFCFALLSSLRLTAQDQHFTQFFAAPLTLNPALSGTFNGKYRVALVYRDQNPYQTYAGAVDLRFGLNSIGKRYKDAFGVGVVFYNDRVPKFGFSNNQINVAAAFHKSLSKSNDQFLSAGFQAGLAQRNFGYERFNFEDQFGGDDGYTNPSAEILPANNFAYGDISAGINYTYAPKKGVSDYAGAAMHQILEPQNSFFYNED
jgi:type IX secretion system PorP/SprF family membrane protein